MSGSKPKLNSAFAARLAQRNDPSWKADLDEIAALEDLSEEGGENGSMLRAELPSPFTVGPPHGAQTENQTSKHNIQSIGLDIRHDISGTPSSRSASLLGGDERAASATSELPSGAGPPLSNRVAFNANLTSHVLYPSHSASATRLPLTSPIESESHGRTEPRAPGPAGQSRPFNDIRPSKRRKISPTRRSASSRSSDGMTEVAAHLTTPREGIDAGSPFSRSMASSLDPAHVPGSSARVFKPAIGATMLSTIGATNSQGLYVQTSNVPAKNPSQSSSNLEKMLGAGISPSDEMRRVFGRAVNHMLPNAETPRTAQIAPIEDDELDGHIRQVAPILATAYSQLVNAGFASPMQLQNVASPLPVPSQPIRDQETDADPTEISRSGTITMQTSRKLKLRPPDTVDQPSSVQPIGSPAPVPPSQGVFPSSASNHAWDPQLHHGPEQSSTRSKGQNRMPYGHDGCDHSELCVGKLHGPGVLRLPKEGTHGAAVTATLQAEAIPSRVGTLESGISNLNKYLATLESELQNAVRYSSNSPAMSARVKEQALPTVVLEFLGPPPLSTARYTFEVTQLEAEAASRWNKRTDLFDPQGDYLEYALDSQTRDLVHNRGPIVDGTVMILLNGKEMASLNATGPIKAHILTSGISQGVNTLEIFALVDATDWTFRVKRSGPSKEEMLKQVQHAAAWRILAF